ncbi:MAG: glycosyl transferase group 1 [Chthonomonadaceae bacterium]|nr:glycosyl transferase group 1 [Chthonomonadaceae bacterium]
MTFLLITPFYRPGVGGSSRLLQDITDHMNATGHRMDVLTYGDPRLPQYQEFDSKQPYRIFRIKPRAGNGLSSVFMFFALLRLVLSRRYKRIFCGVAFPSAILAYALLKLFGIPYWVYSYSEDVTGVKDSRRKRALLTRALQHANHILVISNFTVNEIKALGVPEQKMTLVPPWIDAADYQAVSPECVDALRARLNLQGKRVLLTLARLTQRKGHDNIIKAIPQLCAQHPELHYLIVGAGDPTNLLDLAAAEGIRDRVTIVDYVSDADLPILFHMCEVYAMVSRWDPITKEVEGFGIVYLEAAACGKACVAGSQGGCADAVVDGVTGFVVDPTSPTEIETALDTLFSNADIRDAMGAEGRKRVVRDFDRTVLQQRAATILLTP